MSASLICSMIALSLELVGEKEYYFALALIALQVSTA
jgi:hypothetical protein